MNTIDNLNNYYLPNTLDGINVISQSVSTDALLVDGTNMMLADLNMNNHNIKNLNAGITNDEAVNVGQLNTKANITYVNQQDTLYDTSMNTYVNGLDAQNVKLTTTQTISGVKTFTASTTLQNATNVLVMRSGLATPNSTISIDGAGSYTLNSNGNITTNTINNNNIIFTIGSNNRFLISNSLLRAYVPLDMNTANKIVNLAAGTAGTDATNFSQLIAYDASLSAYTRSQDTLYDASMSSYVSGQDNLRVLKAGDTMTGGLIINSASPQLTLTNGGTNLTTWTQGAGGSATLGVVGNFTINSTGGNSIFLQSSGSTKLTASSTGLTAGGALNMGTTNKITNLAVGTATTDAVNFSQVIAYDASMGTYVRGQDTLYDASMGTYVRGQDTLYDTSMNTYVNGLDAQNVKLTGNQTITSGIKTFNVSPIIPNATTASQAAAYGQLTTIDANCLHKTGDETKTGSLTLQRASQQLYINDNSGNQQGWIYGTGTIMQFNGGSVVQLAVNATAKISINSTSINCTATEITNTGEATTRTAATRQSQLADTRINTWVGYVQAYEQGTTFYDTIVNRETKRTNVEIGSSAGTNLTRAENDLIVSSFYGNIGEQYQYLTIRAENCRGLGGSSTISAWGCRWGLVDPSGNIVASSSGAEILLKEPRTLATNDRAYYNFRTPLTSQYTLTKSGIWGVILYLDYIYNGTLSPVPRLFGSSVNNGDVLQTGMSAETYSWKIMHGTDPGVVLFPTSISTGFSTSTDGIVWMLLS